MKKQQHIVLNGNQAAARIAYKTNEVCAIYPITPASEMSELVEEWSAKGNRNCLGSVPTVYEMQSEAGAAGTLHGALQAGSLATTFTASQGLLLMMPNMYKIAGELTPNVIHVATRSVATHALSVFGDHSDIMAARGTGYAFLGATSVQEAMDFALISQAATLASRIPFVHFFDGFRTSHESNTIEEISDEVIAKMIDKKDLMAHRNRALSPDNPFIRGTSQGSDVFFQSREAVNSFYDDCPEIVQQQMDKFYELTGRSYQLFEYIGHPKAERVLLSMASSTETIAKAVNYLNAQGERVGLIKVHLYRPFSAAHLVRAIPGSCRSIAVLDRTKEPGTSGEPLYLDVVQALSAKPEHFETIPKIVGGRYGLSSKEFTPSMAKAVFDNLKLEEPKNNFTIGINDDVTYLSLKYANEIPVDSENYKAIFYQSKSDKNSESFTNTLQLLSQKSYVQGYTECDYKKLNSRSVSHLRINSKLIKSPYLISQADFIACDDIRFVQNDNSIDLLKQGGTLLVNSTLNSLDFWNCLPAIKQDQIRAKKISLYSVNLAVLAKNYVAAELIFSPLHACFLAIKNGLVHQESLGALKQYIAEVTIPEEANDILYNQGAEDDFSETLLGKLLATRGEEVAVSELPVDGTFPTDTSKLSVLNVTGDLPQWDTALCTQCGACSMACPQAAIRPKVFGDEYLINAPRTFKTVPSLEPEWANELLNHTLQINADQCNSCSNCIDACPAKALTMVSRTLVIEEERENWEHFQTIPEFDRSKIDQTKVSQQQLHQPLFKYSPGVLACGEAPYLKLLSQLFGDRMLVANATGASSIFGGALPTTPWSKNEAGRGPAWSNSLFEDNAEFGLGFRLTLDHKKENAKQLLQKLADKLPPALVWQLLYAAQKNEAEIAEQRKAVKQLKTQLQQINTAEASELSALTEHFIEKSVWIVGGDGWAYDIGYGGLDHVLASGENVNILVLDNEVYSNTGGQMSKATPLGAAAKFAHKGKGKQKKDLGLMAMTYDDVYVGSIAIGADQQQTLKTFLEAESYEGPSLIIAYCHSPSHGIDIKKPIKYHRAAVDSGQWLLYRNDPRRSQAAENPLQLDSKEPSIPIESYLSLEKRFSNYLSGTEEEAALKLDALQDQVDRRYNKYLRMAGNGPFHKFSTVEHLEIDTSRKVKTESAQF